MKALWQADGDLTTTANRLDERSVAKFMEINDGLQPKMISLLKSALFSVEPVKDFAFNTRMKKAKY